MFELLGLMVISGLTLAAASFILAAISAIFILIAWNVGLVGATTALHWPVPAGIGFWTAFGLALLIVSLAKIFSRTETINVDNS